jgi:DNA (cytosine-5)-methyltransferase 1
MKPRLLDLYCCQGGAARGYELAGFEVVGVDIDPQPRYCGARFHQADVLAYLAEHRAHIAAWYDAIHASPPCQLYSKAQRIQNRAHPDLIAPTREALEELGLPYVIENVEDAAGELKSPITLCGESFGLRTYRHRLFEAGGGFTLTGMPHPEHVAPLRKMGRAPRPGEYIHAVGNFSGVEQVRQDYGVPWMNREGIRECIPPAYTEYIGRRLIAYLAPVG